VKVTARQEIGCPEERRIEIKKRKKRKKER
jgi:hypothetical protein